MFATLVLLGPFSCNVHPIMYYSSDRKPVLYLYHYSLSALAVPGSKISCMHSLSTRVLSLSTSVLIYVVDDVLFELYGELRKS
jgi:hypothetical protein